jgi:transposase
MMKTRPENKRNSDQTNTRVSPLECREDERSESNRNGRGLTRAAAPRSPEPTVPNPEVHEKPNRRRFSSSYQARIVREADACAMKGEIGALLRREGLYSSQLSDWRKKYRKGGQAALRETTRGRKPLHTSEEKEVARLKKQVSSLEQRLQKAETIIEIQKKISDLLGIQQPEITSEEND